MQSLFKTKYAILATFMCGIGILLLYVAQQLDAQSSWRPFLSALSSTLIVSGALGLLNKYFLTNELVKLILEKIKLKNDIDRTGIESIYTDLSDIPYKTWMKKSKHIDIVHVYGQTWTNNNQGFIKGALDNNTCKVRVVLLSINSNFISPLAEQYSMDEDMLRRKMEAVKSIWVQLFASLKTTRIKKNLNVYYHTGTPCCSLYRFDDRIVVIQSKLTKGRTSNLPIFVCTKIEKSGLYHMYLDEIESLIKEAQKLDL